MLKLAAWGALSLVLPAPLRAIAASSVNDISPTVNKAALARLVKQAFKQLPEHDIQQALSKAVFIPSIIKRMRTPYEARPYREYRPLFVQKKLAQQGTAYMKKYEKIFSHVMQQYGVQAEIIAAILGMETHFGQRRGNDRVLDSLYTLSAGYPRRAEFFRKELGEFLLMCQEDHRNPESVLGSYAGAFGSTQFIASSYREYAVDADGDGIRDVWDSPQDIIHSVANYFHRHGWDATRPIAHWIPHLRKTTALEKIQTDATHHWHTLAQLIKLGVPRPPEPWQDGDRVSLVLFDTAHGLMTALVHYNFYVITRWNRSYHYAMAATELAAMMGCQPCRVDHT